MTNDIILGLVVLTGLAFDFTNGFHDTANAMATSISTHALSPRIAVALSAVLNLVGAFLSLSVAATIASGLVNTSLVTLTVVFAGLAGAIIWNLITWLFGIPSSSSHALIGGVIGAMLAAAGSHAVLWHGLISKVVLPAVLSPFIAAMVAAAATSMVYRIATSMRPAGRNHGFRLGQIGSASMVSLAHGTNDAQKTMGIITLALIANRTLGPGATTPLWVITACALTIAAGTYIGGWRVIRTLGKGLVEIEPPQGMAAESASAAVILLSTHFGYSLSTTQVATGSILGCGLGKKGAEVRWYVAGRMAVAWVVTLPAAGTIGAIGYLLAHAIGGTAGVLVDLLVLIAVAGVIYWRSRRTRVSQHNVNAQWTGSVAPPEPAAAAASTKSAALAGRGDRMNSWIELKAVGEILGVGLLAGAGLPALFAIGMRVLGTPPRAGRGGGPAGRGAGQAEPAEDRVVATGPAGMAVAAACFAVVLAAIGYGIYIIVKSGHGA